MYFIDINFIAAYIYDEKLTFTDPVTVAYMPKMQQKRDRSLFLTIKQAR